jgi:flavodoxin
VNAVVVYESVFGNTHEIAEAVAEGLREAAEVKVRRVAEAAAEDVAAADLVVVGGPTHVHGMVSHLSMKGATEDAKKKEKQFVPDPDAPILRDWLSTLPKAKGARAAAFDTRIGKPMIVTGSAAKGIAKRLRQDGYKLVAEPESFVVDDSEGPLHEGELERAREWGRSLAKAAG